MKQKKKNKLWMLQAVLCAVCILSAALIYHDYVAIPRQNRELVEELKTCFPEDIPSGGGSPGEKEEQAGREPEVSAVDLRSLQRQYPGVRGWLTIPEVGIDYPVMQSSREDPEYYLRRDYRGNYDINGSLFLQADCILGESKNLTIYGYNMNRCSMDQKEKTECMGLDGMQKMNGAINADLMTVEEIHQKLEAGYKDMECGRVREASEAFTEFRQRHETK